MNSEESCCAPLRFFDRACLQTEGLLLTDFGMAVDDLGISDSDDLPGFCLYGIPAGSLTEVLLEWPTADFNEALNQMSKWSGLGAGQLHLAQQGMSLTAEDISPDIIAQIRKAIRHYGPDTLLIDVLRDEFDNTFEVIGSPRPVRKSESVVGGTVTR